MFSNIKETHFWFPLWQLEYEVLPKLICVFHFKTATKPAFNSYEIKHSCLIVQGLFLVMGEMFQSLAIKRSSSWVRLWNIIPFQIFSLQYTCHYSFCGTVVTYYPAWFEVQN